jgi:hypothetical protein
VTKKFVTPNLNFSSSFDLKVKIMERKALPSPPGTLGERVRFQIIKISKKGAVTVKVKPKVTNTLLIR